MANNQPSFSVNCYPSTVKLGDSVNFDLTVDWADLPSCYVYIRFRPSAWTSNLGSYFYDGWYSSDKNVINISRATSIFVHDGHMYPDEFPEDGYVYTYDVELHFGFVYFTHSVDVTVNEDPDISKAVGIANDVVTTTSQYLRDNPDGLPSSIAFTPTAACASLIRQGFDVFPSAISALLGLCVVIAVVKRVI